MSLVRKIPAYIRVNGSSEDVHIGELKLKNGVFDQVSLEDTLGFTQKEKENKHLTLISAVKIPDSMKNVWAYMYYNEKTKDSYMVVLPRRFTLTNPGEMIIGEMLYGNDKGLCLQDFNNRVENLVLEKVEGDLLVKLEYSCYLLEGAC